MGVDILGPTLNTDRWLFFSLSYFCFHTSAFSSTAILHLSGILNVAAFVGAIPSTSLPLVKAYNYHVNTIIKYDFGLKFHSLNLCKT